MEKLLYNPHQIEDKILDAADLLNARYNSNITASECPVLTPVLQGGLPFFYDLSKFLLFEAYVDVVGVRSYNGKEQGSLEVYKGWDVSLLDKDVWLIDDIADSGNTLAYLEKMAYDSGARYVGKITLLKRHTCQLPLDFHGFTLQDDSFVFGYGMDHPDGLGRLSNSIYQV